MAVTGLLFGAEGDAGAAAAADVGAEHKKVTGVVLNKGFLAGQANATVLTQSSEAHMLLTAAASAAALLYYRWRPRCLECMLSGDQLDVPANVIIKAPTRQHLLLPACSL